MADRFNHLDRHDAVERVAEMLHFAVVAEQDRHPAGLL
jgi:hypothetical protein